MVSTTLTTIVSSSGTGGSSPTSSSSNTITTTNNHHHQYQRPTHSTAGRNYYFATTSISGDPKTTIPTGTTTSISPILIETNINHTSNNITSSNNSINNSSGVGCVGSSSINSNNQNYHYQKIISSCNSPTATNSNISITSGHDTEQVLSSSSLDLTTIPKTLNQISTNQLKSYKNNDSIIFSSSPPLSDQISILFPKCRPKNDINSNPTQQQQQEQNNSIDIKTELSSSTESIVIIPPISSVESSATNSIITTIENNQNRITNNSINNKSPPVSSLSSTESKSSVTPRISTNPFLNSNHHHQLDQSYRSNSSYYNSNSPQNHRIFSLSLKKQKESNCLITNEMPRKRNYHGGSSGSNNGGGGNNQNPFLNNGGSNCSSNNKDIINTNYWETRHNTTPASTVLNSPELTDNHESRNHHHFIQNQKHVKVGRSPVSHPIEQYNNTIELMDTPTHNRGLAVVADGEVVVFDDITENWQNLRVTTESNFSSLGITNINDSTTTANLETIDNNYKDINKKYLDRNYVMISESKPGIMVYEGSPRRIGHPEDGGIDNNIDSKDDEDEEELIEEDDDISTQMYPNKGYQNQLSLYPARPGFPQRIISPPRESPPLAISNFKQHHNHQQQQHQQPQQQQQSTTTTIASNAEDTSNDVSEIGTSSDITTSEPPKSSTFDYLYEFSETRKVLEEFFKCPSTDEKPIENGSDADSIDIHYELHESNRPEILSGETNTNNYIGQRLAGSPMENNYPINNIDGDIDDEDDIEEDEDDDDDDEEEEEEEEIDNIEDIHQQNNYINRINAAIETNSIDKNNHHQQQLQLNDHHQLQQQQQQHNNHDIDFFLDSTSRSSGEQCDNQDGINQNRVQSRSFRYSPETTDYDSNCGDLDSLSGEYNGVTNYTNYAKYYAASMPVLEDGLSSGHASDTENNNPPTLLPIHQQQHQQLLLHQQPPTGISMLMDTKRISIDENIDEATNNISNRKNQLSPNEIYCKLDSSPIKSIIEESGRDSVRSKRDILGQSPNSNYNSNKVFKNIDPDLDSLYSISVFHRQDLVQLTPPPPAPAPHRKPSLVCLDDQQLQHNSDLNGTNTTSPSGIHQDYRSTMHQQQQPQRTKSIQMNVTTNQQQQQRNHLPPPPPVPERNSSSTNNSPLITSDSGITNSNISGINPDSPVWVPRHLDTIVKSSVSINNGNNGIQNLQDSSSTQLLENHHKNLSADEDDVDTDLETDRLLGHQRLDDQGFYDDNKTSSWDRKPRSLLASSLSKFSPKIQQTSGNKSNGSSLLRQGLNSLLPTTPEVPSPPNSQTTSVLSLTGATTSTNSITIPLQPPPITTTSSITSVTAATTKNTTSKLLDIGGSMSSSELSEKSPEKGSHEAHNNCNLDSPDGSNKSKKDSSEKKTKKSKNKEGGGAGAVLIEGVLFRARYLGSTQLVCEGQPTKSTRMMQAEEAVSRIKALAPDGDVQPSTEVDLFISTEKIMVLNTDLKEIMMDHALRTISYIADIGDLVVLMARRRFVPSDIDDGPKPNRTPKMICHVFESDEAQFIAQSIGQAFQVAYMEFLKANGIEDHSFVKEMDYQEVLNSQEIFGDELEIFAKKELQKEVVVPKAKGEILGVVIVESGWGSMLPTVVIANLMSTGAAARCGQLNIGDQLIAINGLSLVGLPLSTCQTYIKNSKNQTVVKFTVVPCPPVVEVKIKRPNTKYQLGFSVQNGVICSLLRGGIAERGGVRVGHRIIEINNQSVVAVPHEKIVNLLATSVGEILMKTMPTSMFRLLTGQENPIYI